jgi:molecular chaperone HtpG
LAACSRRAAFDSTPRAVPRRGTFGDVSGVSDAEMRTTQVDLGGLMRVLGDHLYSTPLVAVRELLQNAHDAIVRRRLEDPGFTAGAIRVRADAAAGTLVVEDDGAGLTHDEIVAYLATVGTGYTRVLREKTASEALIGLFGLGFLSAYVVAERTTVHTTSYQEPARGWLYQSRTGERYALAPAEPRPVGTRVELHLRDRFRALAAPGALRDVLLRYAALLPAPVTVDDDEAPLNAEPPPWRRAPDDPALAHPARARRTRLDFAARFEPRFEPIAALPVEPRTYAAPGSDDPKTDVRGLLWVQDGSTYGNADNRNLHVFVRGMLLDDDHRDLLPAWAGFVGGVVESARLTTTASREDLQRDEAWRATATALEESLVRGLGHLARHEPEAWRRVLARHNEALLGAAIVDGRLFALLADELTVPTSEGDLPVRALLARGKQRVYVSLAARGGFEETLFRALKVPIVAGVRYGALPFVKRYVEARGGAVVQLGTEGGNRAVFREARVDEADRAFLAETLLGPRQRLVTAHFEPPEVPVVLVPDREVALKRRLESDEADRRIASGALALARLYTRRVDDAVAADLYVNLSSPVVRRMLDARAHAPGLARRAARMLRALAVITSGSGEGEAFGGAGGGGGAPGGGAGGDDTLGAALRVLGEEIVEMLGAAP